MTLNMCKHGTDTGPPGGYDRLCWSCEDGKPDRTIRDVARDVHFLRLGSSERDLFGLYTVKYGSVTGSLAAKEVAKLSLGSFVDTLKSLSDELLEIARWTTDVDDDDWMRKRHSYWMREAESAEITEANRIEEEKVQHWNELIEDFLSDDL